MVKISIVILINFLQCLWIKIFDVQFWVVSQRLLYQLGLYLQLLTPTKALTTFIDLVWNILFNILLDCNNFMQLSDGNLLFLLNFTLSRLLQDIGRDILNWRIVVSFDLVFKSFTKWPVNRCRLINFWLILLMLLIFLLWFELLRSWLKRPLRLRFSFLHTNTDTSWFILALFDARFFVFFVYLCLPGKRDRAMTESIFEDMNVVAVIWICALCLNHMASVDVQRLLSLNCFRLGFAWVLKPILKRGGVFATLEARELNKAENWALIR